jgi:hypothetical protein
VTAVVLVGVDVVLVAPADERVVVVTRSVVVVVASSSSSSPEQAVRTRALTSTRTERRRIACIVAAGVTIGRPTHRSVRRLHRE